MDNKATKIMLGAIATILAMFLPHIIGADEAVAELLPYIYGGTFGTLIASGLLTDNKNRAEQKKLLSERKQDIQQLADRYNDAIHQMELAFETRKQVMLIGTKAAKREYSALYEENKEKFLEECKTIQKDWKARTAKVFAFKSYWKKLIAAGILLQLVCCNYTMASMDDLQDEQSTALMEDVDEKVWTARDIPMPHLEDASRYVSNPDGIVTAETEQKLNDILKEMDDSLDIESVVAIVNHVENQDIFRFAQDIFDTYHVGKNDRGLVMVLAYGDHLFRSHTGRSLESDLTDAECSRLQSEYLVPSMKAEMPDSGMLYLTQAIYNLLRHKEMPVMSPLVTPQADDDLGTLPIYGIFTAFWALFFLYIARRYGMLTIGAALAANPFIEEAAFVVTSGGGFGGGGGGGFSGGGGGSFGGGSSGGGGATSSW